ncbi:colipase-like [Protobothrops mucrosquamatus]|uniref:colipase-like n=1 Tax=Protobothrops mucrosquamatus TaxID=103944 RepID=UPI0007758AA6|nr:colipase-like [Protobothrops mucrosquamatus]
MDRLWILLLLTLALAEASVHPRGLVLNLSLYEVYYKCPCESGLICDTDRTIVGSIVNSDFGICKDPSNKISSEKKERKKYDG